MNDRGFEKCWKIIKTWEGTISNHKNDYGGLTIYGIAYNFWKNEPIFQVYFKEGFNKEKLEALAKDFYYRRFYLPLERIFKASEKVGIYTFDMAVNMGLLTSIRLLNKAVGLKDNKINNDMLVRIKDKERIVLYKLFLERIDYYKNIVFNDSSQGVFLLGWLNRSISVLREIEGGV